jgi:hypothetical protein
MRRSQLTDLGSHNYDEEKDLVVIRIRQLAENYLVDSYSNIRVVVYLSIESDRKESRKATISIWRPEFSADGYGLRAVEVAAHKVRNPW